MTVDFAKEYLLDDCADCPENKDGECMTQSHCFEVKRMAIQALEQTRWITVSERLPEKNMVCLVAVGKFNLTEIAMYSDLMGIIDHRIFYQGAVGYDSFEDITQFVNAWMPLPEPYKGESEE